MQLHSLTEPGLIFPRISGHDAGALLRQIAENLCAQGICDSAVELYEHLREREELGSTGIGRGVALPHCKLNNIDHVVLAVAISEKGVDFGAIDDEPVRLFFVVLSPSKDPAAHLKSLAAISKWAKADSHIERILALEDPASIHELLREDHSPS